MSSWPPCFQGGKISGLKLGFGVETHCATIARVVASHKRKKLKIACVRQMVFDEFREARSMNVQLSSILLKLLQPH